MDRAFCKLLVSVSSLSVQARQAYPVCSLEESTPGRKLVARTVRASTPGLDKGCLFFFLNKKCCKRAHPQL